MNNALLNRCFSRHQQGLGLVELMIGMVIGLIILIALGYFFLGSREANRTHDDISRMQESGRHALEILGSAIRQAGYRADADVGFSGTSLTGTDGTPDSITVQYDAQEGGEPNCGAGPAYNTGELVTYAFAVNANRELTCNGSVAADNIEDMQITYGIDNNKDGVIESYQTAGGITFSQVAAVRIVLTVRGPTANAATGGDGFLRQVYTATYTVRNQAG
jgi:type IV pilus assembly protein PilW